MVDPIELVWILHSQVETIGDKYMAVSGLPDPCECHAKRIAHLALDLQDMSRRITIDSEECVVSMTPRSGKQGPIKSKS